MNEQLVDTGSDRKEDELIDEVVPATSRVPPAYSSGDVPPHTAALLELRCHVAALVSLSTASASRGSAASDGIDARQRFWQGITKRRYIHFSLPTTRNVPGLTRVEDEDTIADLNHAQYRLQLPFEIPFPEIELGGRPSSVAYQYHSQSVLACMRKLALIHPSLEERSEWALRADFYEGAGLNFSALEGIPLNFDDDGMGNVISAPPPMAGSTDTAAKRDSIFGDLWKGAAIAVGVPIAVGTGVAVIGIATTGAVLYGSGKALVGLGRAMTCGKLG
jgi:hypothetical protein